MKLFTEVIEEPKLLNGELDDNEKSVFIKVLIGVLPGIAAKFVLNIGLFSALHRKVVLPVVLY